MNINPANDLSVNLDNFTAFNGLLNLNDGASGLNANAAVRLVVNGGTAAGTAMSGGTINIQNGMELALYASTTVSSPIS